MKINPMKMELFIDPAGFQPWLIDWPRYISSFGYISKKLLPTRKPKVEMPDVKIKYDIPIKQKPRADASLFCNFKNGRNLANQK